MIERLRNVLPAMLGLTCARVGLIATTYGSYTSTDENVLTDGATLIALGVLVLCLIFFGICNGRLSEKAVDRIQIVSIALESAFAFGMWWALAIAPEQFELIFGLSIAGTLTGWMCIFYWLRAMHGKSAIEVAVFAFATLIATEVLLLFCASMPSEFDKAFVGLGALCQYPLMRRLRSVRTSSLTPAAEEANAQELLYYGIGSPSVNKTHYLVSIGVGVGALSLVIGVLRGYPDGLAIPFTPITRAAYAVVAILLSLAILGLLHKGRQRILSVGIFTIMEALAVIALLLYAAFPTALEIGAVATTALNALMVGFTWYIVVVFMTHGWRDPYYYAFGGWIVWLGCRAVARIALLEFNAVAANDLFVTAALGGLIVLSTQIVLIRLLHTSTEALEKQPSELLDGAQEEVAAEPQKPRVIERLMGLDDHPRANEQMSLSDIRAQTMRRCAREMGRHFLLSEREVDVLTLYALGYTQKRVADELVISQNTAHAHIKRIYSKTDMHSRQELIDYLELYADKQAGSIAKAV